MHGVLLLWITAVALVAGEAVAVDGLWFLDAVHNRNLGCKIYHPVAMDGAVPVIVFSHGLGGSQWGYEYLGRHWAEQGYVSIHVSHPGSDWLLWDGKSMSEGLHNLRAAVIDPVVYASRPRDISFILDQFAEIERRVPALAGHLDHQRIGVAGHSLGAHTALALVGMRVDQPDHPDMDLSDPRLRAVIALSPLGEGRFQSAIACRNVAKPVLMVMGSEDEQPLESQHALEWRLQSWTALPPGERWLCVIPGATHMTFAGGGLGQRAEPEHLQAIQVVTDRFWEAELRQTPDTSHLLDQDPSQLAGVRWESKRPPP